MTGPREEIARERRRQMQVRKAFEAGLGRGAAGEAGLEDFYRACAGYICFSMDRLHSQDQIIHDLLCVRVPETDQQAHERLGELERRQSRSRLMVERLRDALRAFERAGAAGRSGFEVAARRFTEAFQSLLAARKNPFAKHTDELFDEADWERIAGVTPESLAAEQRLFAAVEQTAPAGVHPARMTVEHS